MEIGVDSTMGRHWCLGGILSVVFSLGGCSEPTSAPDQGIMLVLKHSKLFGDPEPFDRLLARFEQTHPGVQVKREILPSSSDEQHQFYAINLQAKSADFDVFALDVIWVAEFARAGWLRDLSHRLPPEARSAFFPGPLAAVTYAGRIYALPWFIDAGLLYYRKDLLVKHGYPPPRTWSELIQSARAILAKEPDLYGYVWQGKQYEGLVCNVLEVLWSHGGEVLRDGRVALDSVENRRGLMLLHDLIHAQKISPALVTTATEEPAREIFGGGRAIFMRNWPYARRLFERDGSPVRGKVGVSLLPHAAGKTSAATLGGWQLGVNRYSRHPEEAERLAEYLTSETAQKAIALAYGFSPPRKSLYKDRELVAAQPFLADLYQIFERARPRPVTPYYVMLSQVLQAEFSAAIAGIKSPGEALADAQRQIADILRR
jgi:multiple sugar transport system substrate-binding protein